MKKVFISQPIPDNPTNGDIIKAMFPDAEINDNKFLEHIYVSVNGTKLVEATVDARREWWDLPYEKAIEALKDRPTGHWIGDKCSVCGEERAWYGCNPAYCPDCGSRMQRED